MPRRLLRSRARISTVLIGAYCASLAACGRIDSADVMWISLDDVESCSRCTIEFDSLTTLEGVEFTGPASAMQMGLSGDFYLANPRERLLTVYDQAGRALRQVGRLGAGPGEYEQVRNVMLGQDEEVHILDGTLNRHSVFDRQGRFLRSRQVDSISAGYGRPALLLNDGRLVINGRPRTPEDTAPALWVLDTAGKVHGMEAMPVVPASRRRWLSERVLSHTPSGGMLVARPYQFEVDLYSPHLSLERRIRLRAGWIPTHASVDPPSDGLFDRAMTPHIQGAWMDGSDVLWLYMVVPLASWRPEPPPPPAERLTTSEMRALAERDRAESIVAVVDLAQGRVVARKRFGADLGVAFQDGHFAVNVLTAKGEPGVRVSRVVLDTHEGGRK